MIKKIIHNLQRAAVIGLGISGKAIINYCISRNINVIGIDSSDDEKMLDYKTDMMNKYKNIEILLGTEYNKSYLDTIDLVIKSPGVPNSYLPVRDSADADIPIIGDFIFASYLVPGRYICITGTNGKTTTTKLIYEILKEQFDNVYLAGNIGYPLIDLVSKNITNEDIIICELSSYQIEQVYEFQPYISIILNVTPDHMDRYDTFKSYMTAKYNIFNNQTDSEYLIMNYNERDTIKDYKVAANIKYFGLCSDIETGIIKDNKQLKIVDNNKIQLEEVYPENDRLVGQHNIENVLASFISAYLCEVPVPTIKHAIEQFRPPEFRLEYKGTFGNRKIYNDSKSTTIASVIAAINSFTENIILFLGGQEKNTDFTILNKFLSKDNVKRIIVFGKAKTRIYESLIEIKNKLILDNTDNFKAIIEKALYISDENDIILFSPGCASFDMFDNYKHRGRMFNRNILELVEKFGWKKQ